ncbi:virulence factor SrfC family protein [Gluconobacter sp. Dm-74]|nr:virulence factor SrfC family protein [Gluconobacter sp. Dm-74]
MSMPVTLASQTRTLASLATTCADWVQHHAAGASPSCRAALRRERRLAHRLQAAASRPAAVAVYGASQAGKSYLMSSLSSPAEGPLLIRYGQHTLDFLMDMNPPGGDESSGLVSRFTLNPPAAPANAPPIPVRLLSVTDIIRIVGNTFLSDFKLIGIKPREWRETSQMLETLPRSAGGGIFTIDDIEVLEEYFTRKFGDRIWLSVLGEPYWDWLAAAAPELPLQALITALSPLWGQTPELTTYATELVSALLSLGQVNLAFCDVEALVPRSDSILNVSTLFRPPMGMAPLRLVGENGSTVTLPRNIVSAIVSELVVPMAQSRWEFVKTTDLLDFPGARSRLEIRELSDVAGVCGKLFLRGKVDYLFELYQADMEVTSTLLCVADSAQEVTGLPAMIEGWINDTIGKTPRERKNQADALFVILTKFDRQFEEKGGADENSSDVWDKRLEASLINFFDAPWVTEWKPGQPFNNVQWLRASTVGSLYRRDAQKRETEMLPENHLRVERRRNSYLASTTVDRHIQHAPRAFDEAIRPNDGGVSYLAERLKSVCESKTKNEQLAARLKACTSNLLSLMRPFYHDPAGIESGAEARRAASEIAQALLSLHRNRLFGAFLLRLELDRSAIIEQWRDFSSTIHHTPPPVPVDDLLGDILGDAIPVSAPQEDQHDRFASLIIEHWINDRLLSLLAHPEQLAVFNLDLSVARQFIERLQKLAETLNLREAIAQRLRLQCNHVSTLNQSGEKQALICAELIGRFVTYLGYANLASEARPRQRNSDIAIFSAPPTPRDYPVLSEQPSVYLDTFFRDWVLALRSRFEEGGPQFDVDANHALEALLSRLETSPL